MEFSPGTSTRYKICRKSAEFDPGTRTWYKSADRSGLEHGGTIAGYRVALVQQYGVGQASNAAKLIAPTGWRACRQLVCFVLVLFCFVFVVLCCVLLLLTVSRASRAATSLIARSQEK